MYSLAAWWHLLSLDAPTVAALWSWFFARAMHLRMPLISTWMLGLATWLLYVTDRILDGLRHPPDGSLHERHYFHARHRRAFLATASLLTVPLVWCVCTRMRAETLRDDTWIGGGVLLYLLAVHRRGVSPKPPRLPKELVVAIVFSAATAVPAWSHMVGKASQSPGREQLVPAVLFFTLLCWVNCVGIDKWEAPSPLRDDAHPITRWAGSHLRLIVTIIALFSIAAAVRAPSQGLMAVYLAALLSSGLFFLLDTRSRRLSPLRMRIAADAALLTPLALFPLAR